jgi:hypothetical protein
MQAKGCGILGRHTAWRFTKCMMMTHNPKVANLKACSGMTKKVTGEYFGRRGPDRQSISNDAV